MVQGDLNRDFGEKANSERFEIAKLIANNVLEYAINSCIIGDVRAEWDVLCRAENSYIKGNVEAGADVLTGAKNSHIEGDVEIWRNPKGTKIEVDLFYILAYAKNSYVRGNVNGAEDVLKRAENSHIKGNVEVESILSSARNSYIIGDISFANEHTLWSAINCYILTNRLHSGFSVGRDAEGGLVAAKKISLSKDVLGKRLYPRRIPVLTQTESYDGVIKYNGDWDELSDWFSAEIRKENRGALSPLEIFCVEKEELDLDELKAELKKLATFCTPDIKENLKKYRKIIKNILLGKYLDYNEERGDVEDFSNYTVFDFRTSKELGLKDIFEMSNEERHAYLKKPEFTIPKL